MFGSSVPWVQPCDDCSRRDTLESLEHTTTYWRQQRFCPPAPLDVQNDWRTRPPGFNFIPISSYRHMDQIDSSSNTATIEIPNHKCSPVHRHPFLFTSVPRAWTDVKHKNTRKEPPLFFRVKNILIVKHIHASPCWIASSACAAIDDVGTQNKKTHSLISP